MPHTKIWTVHVQNLEILSQRAQDRLWFTSMRQGLCICTLLYSKYCIPIPKRWTMGWVNETQGVAWWLCPEGVHRSQATSLLQPGNDGIASSPFSGLHLSFTPHDTPTPGAVPLPPVPLCAQPPASTYAGTARREGASTWGHSAPFPLLF